MNEARILWAFFLACMVAWAFRRSWRMERGLPVWPQVEATARQDRETPVWVSPLYLPILLLLFFALILLIDGIREGMLHFLGLLADVLLACSLHYILLLLFLPLLRRYFSARACATMWLMPVFLFYQLNPLVSSAYPPRLILRLPESFLPVFLCIWLAGFVLVFSVKIWAHLRFRRKVLESAAPVEDESVRALWEEELAAAAYKKPLRLVQSPAAAAPFSMGRGEKRRVTVLPEREYTPQALRLIFRHEIRHVQRLDVDTKIFFAFCGALCWFNPLVWIAIRRAGADLELSCDEIVLEKEDEDARRTYAELLLHTAGDLSQGFTTCLSSSARALRYRLRSILARRTRFQGTALLFFSMFACTMFFGLVVLASGAGSLGEAAFPESCRLERAYYSGADGRERQPSAEGAERLFTYISTLPVDRLCSAVRFSFEDMPRYDLDIWLITPDGSDVLLRVSESCLAVQRIFQSSRGTPQVKHGYYIPRVPIDWALVDSCFQDGST